MGASTTGQGNVLPVSAHLSPSLIAVVAVGGAVGTLARYALSQAVPASDGGVPVATAVENVVGAFLLGLLLEVLVRPGGVEGRRRRLLRLGLGTGLLGGFTTYSAFALETRELLVTGEVWVAFGYVVGSLVLGLLACAGGVRVGSGLARRRVLPLPVDPYAPGGTDL